MLFNQSNNNQYSRLYNEMVHEKTIPTPPSSTTPAVARARARARAHHLLVPS